MPDPRPLGRAKRARRRLRTPNPEARRRLLDAAAALIAEQGFPALRVEEIAERAGLSVGTFYLYFESKADLFVALVMAFTERLRVRLRSAYRSEGTVVERLLRALDEYLAFVAETEAGFLHFIRLGDIETTQGSLSEWAFERHAEDLRPILIEGMERGEIRREDPDLLVQAILGLHQHLAGYWLKHKQRHSRDGIAQFLTAFASRALLPEPDPLGEAGAHPKGGDART